MYKRQSEDFESYAVKDNIAFSGAITHEGTDANGRTADIKNDAAGRSKYARLTSPVSNWIRVTPPAFTSTEDFTTVFSFNAGPEGNMGAMTCRLRPTAQNGNYKSATTFLKVMGDGTFNVQKDVYKRQGYTCGDLFFQNTLLDAAEEALFEVAQASEGILTVVGLPVRHGGKLYKMCIRDRFITAMTL